MDLHAEPVDPHGRSYEKQVFGGLEFMFRKYPALKLILSHTAMTNLKPILKHHLLNNLEPITNSQGRLYHDWAELFEEMPERFMVGSDEKFGWIGKGVLAAEGSPVANYGKTISRIRKILGSIHPNAAEQIAHKNAWRIFP